MRLDEEAVGPGGEGREGKGGHELALAGALPAARARQLHGVRRVEDRGEAIPGHDRERAHVDHEVLVAEGRAALGLPHLARAAVAELGGHVRHLRRREELPLLHVHHPAGGGRRQQEIRLPAEEGRDLQHVAHLGDAPHLGGLMDVRQHGKAVVASHEGKEPEALLQAGAAGAGERRAVGLVEGSLEDDIELRMRVAQAGEDLRHRAADGLALEGAGPGDEQQPARVEEHGGTGAPGATSASGGRRGGAARGARRR